MLILYGDGMLSFSPKFNKQKSITNNKLPAMSIRLGDIILGFDRSFFWISLPEAEIQVIKVELCCDIWLNFALVTFRSCAFIWKCIGTLSFSYCTTQISCSFPLLPVQIYPQTFPHYNQTSASLTKVVNYQIFLTNL